MAVATVDPSTGQTLQVFPELTDAELEDRLRSAHDAFAAYRLTSVSDRARWLAAAADLLEADTDTVARMVTTEMGKTLVSARQEVAKCVATLRWFAERAAALLAPQPADAAAVGASRAYVSWQPLGVVLAVMPWNFPLWQVIRFAAPALAGGNAGLLKHASSVPRTALYLQELFARAGFPAGVFTTLLVGTDRVERVLRDPRVAAATLTGSEAAGRAMAATAGSVLKKMVLELGGSDPFVVMPSADLARAARVGTTARCLNNGQSCINAKRFYVHRAVAEPWLELFCREMGSQVVGDPEDPATDVGPLVSQAARERVESYVADAVAKGARVLVGGARPDRPGWFYPPTVLTGVTSTMDLYTGEVFGPVAAVSVVDSLAEAVALANEHPYGLGADLFSEDPADREQFVRDIESGMVFVNGNTTSHPDLPFGGVKASGYGRELTELGMREFLNARTVWVGR